MEDRRTNSRRRTFLGAQVRHPGGLLLNECIVRDLSKTGARLSFSRPIELPGSFEIEITKTGERHWAQVVWSARGGCGVQFEPEGARSRDLDWSSHSGVQSILEAACRKVASTLGVDPAVVSLRLEVADPEDAPVQ